MSEEDGLVCAFHQGPDGTWSEIGWPEVNAWKPGDGFIWVHIDFAGKKAGQYLKDDEHLDDLVVQAMLAQESRPRVVAIDDCLLINLRGVNLNPGANADDMVSIRLWASEDRIISSRHRKIMAINDIREDISANRGPQSPGDFVVELSTRLIDRMSDVIVRLNETEDELESLVVTGVRKNIRHQIAEIRKESIKLRRYLAPQREALNRLQSEPVPWMNANQYSRLREVSDRLIRYVEDLDAVRERAAVIQDEVMNRFSEEMNRNTYVFAIVATVLLPLGFLTGLLGINVDGMPGSVETPWAFGAVVAICVVFVIVELFIMKLLKWF